jgi:hypothetical protein
MRVDDSLENYVLKKETVQALLETRWTSKFGKCDHSSSRHLLQKASPNLF